MRDEPYDPGSRLIHLLLALLGIAAVVSGQFAGDYFKRPHLGFDLHRWIGLAAGGALLLRLAWGVAGPVAMRFSRWFETHERLAGAVQAIGLAAFAWMAATGALLFAFLDPGVRSAGWLRAVKELHEGGQAVVLAYLALHVGAVLAHAVTGRPVWRRMFSLRRPAP